MPKARTPARRKALLISLGLLVLIIAGAAAFYGPVIADFARAGFFERASGPQKWTPETEKNLQVLYAALKMHHDSEGAFPKADRWMAAIEKRVRTNTLDRREARKKFIDPAAGGGPVAYGFGFNDIASEKYIDDIPDKKALLIFQSNDASWNAHGDPAIIARRGGIGITVDGALVRGIGL